VRSSQHLIAAGQNLDRVYMLTKGTLLVKAIEPSTKSMSKLERKRSSMSASGKKGMVTSEYPPADHTVPTFPWCPAPTDR
jgi:hypothetical protein